MFEIKRYERLTENIFLADIYSPRVAKVCLPGQFVICRTGEDGERIPLTVCDYDREKGTVTVVVQEIGASTLKMGRLREGDRLTDFVGPLGKPSELTETPLEELKKKKIVFVAGGVGTAPVYPQMKWLAGRGVRADAVIGAKTASLVILEEEIAKVAGRLTVATDDGSRGEKGLVTDALKKLVGEGNRYDLCVAIGPVVMMKFVSLLTAELGIPTVVSMNPIMVDGTGMCGACRLTVGGKIRFACVDGPEFDGHEVDFDETMKRQRLYRTEEGRAYLKAKEGQTHHGGCGLCGKEE